MQSLVTLLVGGIALFALGCLAFGLVVVGAAWAVRRIGRAAVLLGPKAKQRASSCYNEPLQSV